MIALLFTLALVSPFVGVLVLGRLAVHLVVTVRRRSAPDLLGAGTFLLAALLALCAAGSVYIWGVSYGVYVLDPDEVCGYAQWGEHEKTVVWESSFPLSVHCADHPGDPGGRQLIPDWVNPAFVAAAVTAAACTFAAPFAAVARRKALGGRTAVPSGVADPSA
ncbi:hypothetical protein [Streptomyces sp. NBC_01443]|uniref:hypothetical protein n=1 Tax=Streptomyces sp. NBC_01443 TaxID=2903868 RepID=UPI0022524A6D|nr:hypothetical protein [Streptomyces sp. NBC_01443]MCX4629762.1 hypothetical protein [Streptomyces sp. NBC_01443]